MSFVIPTSLSNLFPLKGTFFLLLKKMQASFENRMASAPKSYIANMKVRNFNKSIQGLAGVRRAMTLLGSLGNITGNIICMTSLQIHNPSSRLSRKK